MTNTERDELAKVILDTLNPLMALELDEPTDDDNLVADAILAAGYRKPQQVTTVEELDALRIAGTAIEWGGKLYGAELAVPGDRPCWFGPGRATATTVTPSADFPATVLHVGGAE